VNDFSEKTILSAYFSCSGFVSIEFRLQRERCNTRFFTETVLPSIEKFLSVARPRMRAKDVHLHIDNAKPHNSEISLSKTDEMRFIRVSQQLYSADLVSCDFLLFRYPKEQLEGRNVSYENNVILAV
jgi:hypothetical protein